MSNDRDCHVAFATNTFYLQLCALAYNLGNFMRMLAMSQARAEQ